MIKRSRPFLSAVLLTVFAVSVFLFNPVSVKACDDAPPATLLALYLRSDLIFVAEVRSEKDAEITDDAEAYYFVDVERRLKVSSIIKGRPGAHFVFTQSEYREKKKNADEAAPTEQTEEEIEIVHEPYGYKAGDGEIKVGERYLFFFEKDSETNRYNLTDPISGAKKLDDAALEAHENRLKELRSIVRAKKNQAEALTAWLIRLVEDPSTRWDGLFDLNESFRSLEYAAENGEETNDALVLDRNYGGSTAIAKSLSDAQKEYLSSLLFDRLQRGVYESGDEFYYGLTSLVGRWDKQRVAMYAFGDLQSADRAAADRTKSVMKYLAAVVDDEKLSEIAERFPASDNEEEENEEAPAKTSEEVKAEEPTTVDAAVKSETPVVEPGTTPAVEPPTAPAVDPAVKNEEAAEEPKTIEPAPKKLTRAEVQEKVLREFNDRYQYLVAIGFEKAKTDPVAEK